MKYAFRVTTYMSLLLLALANAGLVSLLAKDGVVTEEVNTAFQLFAAALGALLLTMAFAEVVNVATEAAINQFGKHRIGYGLAAVAVYVAVSFALLSGADGNPEVIEAYRRVSLSVAIIPALLVIRGAITEDDLRRVLPRRVVEAIE